MNHMNNWQRKMAKNTNKKYDEPRVDVGTYFGWTIVPAVIIIAIICFVELYLSTHFNYFAFRIGSGGISSTLVSCLQPGVLSYIIAFLISFLTKHTRNLNFFYKCFAIAYIIWTILQFF